jgi:hypothetical protein
MTAKQVCDRWFATQRIEEGLYLITEPHYYWYNRANLWLIKGRDRDLLVDTGLGVASLRQHISALIDKPLLAIASHIHFDLWGLQKLPISTVYPGHYRSFGREKYQQILGEYLDRRRQPGCPSEVPGKHKF